MKLRCISTELFQAEGPISSIGPHEIEVLRGVVYRSPKRRVRINLHPKNDDTLHEMIIAIDKQSYIRPHFHPNKSESFHVIDGCVDVIIFDECGDIIKIVELGAPGTGRAFYYRMSEPFFHTLVVCSELLIIHETTNGPFEAGATQFAKFAPEAHEIDSITTFCRELKLHALAFKERRMNSNGQYQGALSNSRSNSVLTK
jgi:cupin fold WbuC family metalloprotein